MAERLLLRELSGLLGTRPEDAPAALRTRLALLADAEAELERLHRAELASAARALSQKAQVVPGGLLVAARVDGVTGRRLRELASAVAEHVSSGLGLVVLCTPCEGRALLVCAVGRRLRERLDAREVIREAAALIGGSPSGRGACSNAAGPRTEELGSALLEARAAAVGALRRSMG
ncbi:DHHA1 domain-containing protein [Streptomyces sp. NPDC013740]|uniref:DHHA1 domain-containing protein n=1 Tax=Streptomyces sp. NPDC013740 TaxID=3364867 RepID=UPI0037025A7C